MAEARSDLTQRREALGLTKTNLARLLEVNRATVHRWESGESTPRPELRSPLARALQLTMQELDQILRGDDGPAKSTMKSSLPAPMVGTVERKEEVDIRVDRREFITGLVATGVSAALPFDSRDAGQSVRALQAAVGRTVRLEQRSQYAALSALLPGVITEAKHTIAATSGLLRQEATRHLVMAQVVKAFIQIKLDQPADAQATATDALMAAQAINDPVLVATVLRCLAETYMRGGTYDLAADLAIEGAGHIARHRAADPQALAVQGAALLTAASACARNGERQSAFELLDAAQRCADGLRHDHIGSVMFGPTNVAIHRVAFEVELDDPIEALRQAEQTKMPSSPAMAERHARYLLDVARAQAQLAQGAEAVSTMLEAESIAAEEIRTHRHSRTVLAGLLDSRQGGVSMELRPLAQRCGALIGS